VDATPVFLSQKSLKKMALLCHLVNMVLSNQDAILKHSVSGQPSQEEIQMAKYENKW
jgi:hypothetical protein